MRQQQATSIPAVREEIRRCFQQGDFRKAVFECQRAGCPLGQFQADLEQGAERLVASRRAGTVLDFMDRYNLRVQYAVPALLRAVFEAGDYHGFLKNVHRFKAVNGFEHEVGASVAALTEKGHAADAQAWEKKIKALQQ